MQPEAPHWSLLRVLLLSEGGVGAGVKMEAAGESAAPPPFVRLHRDRPPLEKGGGCRDHWRKVKLTRPGHPGPTACLVAPLNRTHWCG